MKILYSFNKVGFELDYWQRELKYTDSNVQIIPFNHGSYISPSFYLRAQQLDDIFYNRNKLLFDLYSKLQELIKQNNIDCLIVDNANPYHPELLKTLAVKKVLRTSDGPMTAYDRIFPYVHAFDAVLYHSPAYSQEINMREKLTYLGVKEKYFWSMGSFDALRSRASEKKLFDNERDVDIVFVGALFPNKMELLASVKNEFGKNFKLFGLANWKKNLYFNLKYKFPGIVRPLSFENYVPLYEKSKIGINVHNRGKYTVGGYRMFDLPANGVMQISDGEEYLEEFFKVGVEVESYSSKEELVDKVKYYLKHDAARIKIAKAGYKKVMESYLIKDKLRELSMLIKK